MGVMRRSGIAVVYSGKSKDKVAYCHKCLEVNVLSPLKHRIYLDEHGNIITNPPPDSKNWKQCWQCGDIVGTYEAKQEADIVTLTEPADNPFKFGHGIVRSVGDTRKFDRTGKTQHKRKFKQDLEQYKEEDVKEALRKGSKLVSYEERIPK
jgi:hypothetical protein